MVLFDQFKFKKMPSNVRVAVRVRPMLENEQ